MTRIVAVRDNSNNLINQIRPRRRISTNIRRRCGIKQILFKTSLCLVHSLTICELKLYYSTTKNDMVVIELITETQNIRLINSHDTSARFITDQAFFRPSRQLCTRILIDWISLGQFSARHSPISSPTLRKYSFDISTAPYNHLSGP